MPFSERELTKFQASYRLTDRECQILCGILQDKSEARIARELGISQNNVHSRVRHIYQKLGVNTRASLVVSVYEYMACCD